MHIVHACKFLQIDLGNILIYSSDFKALFVLFIHINLNLEKNIFKLLSCVTSFLTKTSENLVH